MSASLDPVVVTKLRHFSRRRRRLITARGIAAGLVTAVLGTALVSLADWFWLLADQVRWGLSAAVYLSVVGVIWWTSLRLLFKPVDRRELAGQMEELQPELREQLLSAVELATDDLSLIHDSPVFRKLLQSGVAQLMVPIRVQHLLPIKLIAYWLVAAMVVVTLAIALLSGPDQRFRQLATRALFPGANVARISRIQVEVIDPQPASQTVAENETVAIRIKTSGGRVRTATLETVTAKQGTSQQRMATVSENEFIANIDVGEEDIEYRILAGDAITEYFFIDSVPRPRVAIFRKHYSYPEYAELPEEEVEESHGDILVLEGTTARLELELNQRVSEAELRMESAQTSEVTVVALQADPQNPLIMTAELPIEHAAIYKVHLVSADTGFSNAYSPKYEIRPVADLIPRAGFVDQQVTTLLLPPNDLLALQGMGEDDLPLVKLEQQISINGQAWETIDLEFEAVDDGSGRQVAAQWQWDLAPLGLETGDQVLTKLVAVDRKGNRGESVPLRVVIAAADYDPQRHNVMEAKLAFVDDLQDLSARFEEQKVSVAEVLDRLLSEESAAAMPEVDGQVLKDAAIKQREAVEALLETLGNLQGQMPAGADSQDVELAGRVISRLGRERTVAPLYLLVQLASPADAAQRKALLQELKQAFERSADDASALLKHFQQLATFNFLRALALDADALRRQQEYVVESPTQTWERLLRQESVVLQQLESFEKLIQQNLSRLPDSTVPHLSRLVLWSEQRRQQLRSVMESEDQLPRLQATTKTLMNEINGQQRIESIDNGLQTRLNVARKDLERRSGPLYTAIHEVGATLQQRDQWLQKATEADDSVASKEASRKIDELMSQMQLSLQGRLRRFDDQQDLTEARPDADRQYAADLGLTRRAVNYLLHQADDVESAEALEVAGALLKIAPAYRTLEAGHDFALAYAEVQVLREQERWDHESQDAHIDHPRQWDLVQQQLETASVNLRQARVPEEISRGVDEARWSQSVRDAGRKINERRWNRELMVGAGYELLELQALLQEVQQDLDPVMDEARAIIARYAPTIAEMARQAAEEVRELEQATTEAADELESDSEPETMPLDPLEAQQEQVNRQIEDLFEALIEDANNQDLLDQDQRERALDADAAIATVQPPAIEMNQALQRALDETDEQAQVQELAEAAEDQERTAQALERVAEHFERLENGEDVTESREALREAFQQNQPNATEQQAFEQAQELSEMLEQPVDDLMRELEEELKRNPAMQEALSEIAKNTLEDAQDALEFAARDEENIQRDNERADQVFQQKKTDLVNELKELGNQATELSNTLANRAQQAAQQGKTPEAVQELQEARQELQQATAAANQARDDQTLRDLSQVAQVTRDALREATETLRSAEGKTEKGKNEEVHADAQAREAAKTQAEKQHQEFVKQQTGALQNEVNRLNQVNQQAENRVNQAEQRVEQAQKQMEGAKANAEANPENQGLQQALAREEANLDDQRGLLEQSKSQKARAQQKADEAQSNLEQLKNQSPPQLNAANPDTQLADQYTEDAIKRAEQLNRRAEQLADSSDFGETLEPPRSRLAASQEQQEGVAQDVQQVADDLARAARHERRLENQTASEAVQQASEQVQQVADQQVNQAEQGLAEAVEQADQNGGFESDASQVAPAQQALAESQDALAEQAENLGQTTEDLLNQGQLEPNAGEPNFGEPNSGEQSNGEQGMGEQSNGEQGMGEQSNGEPMSGESPSGEGQGQPSEGGQPSGQGNSPPGSPMETPSPGGFTPEEQQLGQQLAQALDELDRLQASEGQEAMAGQEGQPLPITSLQQALQQSRAALAASRASRQQQAMQAMNEGMSLSEGVPPDTGAQPEFELRSVNRKEDREWGKLRQQAAEDLSRGGNESVSSEYRMSVEAYFKVLAERAGQKK